MYRENFSWLSKKNVYPIVVALQKENWEFVTLLLEHGADPELTYTVNGKAGDIRICNTFGSKIGKYKTIMAKRKKAQELAPDGIEMREPGQARQKVLRQRQGNSLAPI
jgi:hypothetical protein